MKAHSRVLASWQLPAKSQLFSRSQKTCELGGAKRRWRLGPQVQLELRFGPQAPRTAGWLWLHWGTLGSMPWGGVARRADCGDGREQKKIGMKSAQLIRFRHSTTSVLFVCSSGSTDCVQGLKGCKGRKSEFGGKSGRVIWRRGKKASGPFFNRTTSNCIFSLDTTRAAAQNPRQLFPRVCGPLRPGRKKSRVISEGEKSVQYLPGWSGVQCINPECAARGHWLRAADAGGARAAAIAALRSTMFRPR